MTMNSLLLWFVFVLPMMMVLPGGVVGVIDDDDVNAMLVEELVWEPRSGYNGLGRHHPITFANESHGFLLTGTTVMSSGMSDIYMYDEANDEWIELLEGAFPGGKSRSFGYGVVLNEAYNPKAYLGFGATVSDDGEEERLSDWWEFDMSTHDWKQLATFPGPGRRHPAMVPVLQQKENEEGNNDDGKSSWEIHVGLGDGIVNGEFSNFKDWWKYDIDTDTWVQLPDFPSSKRHHPFYFGLDGTSYVGLGHSDGYDPYIERDFYSFHHPSSTSSSSSEGIWKREADFASYNASVVVNNIATVNDDDNNNNNTTAALALSPKNALNSTTGTGSTSAVVNDAAAAASGEITISYSEGPMTTEARVAGTQFSIVLPLRNYDANDNNNNHNMKNYRSDRLSGSLGFVLSGDGDDHRAMETGEFHAFYPGGNAMKMTGPPLLSSPSSSWWRQLPPHPGYSRWAPGSFVMRGSARVYFTSGFDRAEGMVYNDLWRIDVSSLFVGNSADPVTETIPSVGEQTSTATPPETMTSTTSTSTSTSTTTSASEETTTTGKETSSAVATGIDRTGLLLDRIVIVGGIVLTTGINLLWFL